MDRGNNTDGRHLLRGHLYHIGFVMSDLRIKPNVANGDLPEQMDLFDDGDNEMNWLKESFNPGLSDIFNPLKMKEALDKANGRIITPKDKE